MCHRKYCREFKPSSITQNLNIQKFHFPSKVRKKFSFHINVEIPAVLHQTISDITILTHEKTLLQFSLNKTELLIGLHQSIYTFLPAVPSIIYIDKLLFYN